MFVKNVLKVSGLTMLSRILGLARDSIVAFFLGTSAFSDAFVIAFKLPNVFRRLFAEGSLNSVFTPIFSKLIVTEPEMAKQFSREVFTILVIVLLTLIVVFQLTLPWLMLGLAPGFYDNYAHEYNVAIILTRITIFYLLFMSLVALYNSILNSVKRFAVGAALPFVLNLSIISFFCFSEIFHCKLDSVYFGAMGITFAGLVQFLIMLFCVNRVNLLPSFTSIRRLSYHTKLFFKRIVPVLFTAGTYQINIFVDLTIASWLTGGSITYLYYADRLGQLPLAIIGIAISTVMVPYIVDTEGNKKDSESISSNSILYSALLGIAATLAFFILGREIITMLYNYGKFNQYSVDMTYRVLFFYSVGLAPNIVIKVIIAIFYAKGESKIPLWSNFSVLLLNIGLSLLFAKYLGVCGIALATALCSVINLIILMAFLILKGYLTIKKDFIIEFIKGCFVTTITFVALYLLKQLYLENLLNHIHRLWFSVILLVIIVATILVWFLGLKVVKSKLYSELLAIKKKVDS